MLPWVMESPKAMISSAEAMVKVSVERTSKTQRTDSREQVGLLLVMMMILVVFFERNHF
jgi:hypothetical protein